MLTGTASTVAMWFLIGTHVAIPMKNKEACIKAQQELRWTWCVSDYGEVIR